MQAAAEIARARARGRDDGRSSRCAGSSTSPASASVIPGARNAEQARGNAAAAPLPPLTDEQQADVRRVYDERIREYVQDRW